MINDRNFSHAIVDVDQIIHYFKYIVLYHSRIRVTKHLPTIKTQIKIIVMSKDEKLILWVLEVDHIASIWVAIGIHSNLELFDSQVCERVRWSIKDP